MTTSQRTSPRERTLLRQAKRAADNGKLTAALELYQELLSEFPASVGGTLGYARVVRDEDERIALLNKALELDPENEIAKAGLRGESLETLLNPPAPEPEPVTFPAAKEPEAEAHTHQVEEDEVGGLRCNRCGKPIEATNAIHTSVGYRCKECVREIESSYFTATTLNQAIAFMVALPLATIAAYLIGRFIGNIGFFSLMITFFLSPAVGGAIGSVAFQAAGKNRGRMMPSLMSAAIWIGSLIALGILFLFFGRFAFLTLGIFAFTASGAAYFRVR